MLKEFLCTSVQDFHLCPSCCCGAARLLSWDWFAKPGRARVKGPSHKKTNIRAFTERERAVGSGLHMESRAAPPLQILSQSRILRFLNKKKNALSLSRVPQPVCRRSLAPLTVLHAKTANEPSGNSTEYCVT